jgi:hypothetical protein
MSKKEVEARFTFNDEWYGRKVFEDLCKLERIFVLPDVHDSGEGAREACKLTLVHEWSEYDIEVKGGKRMYSCTWLVCAPEWRVWSLMERLDARKICYETDFGLIVE